MNCKCLFTASVTRQLFGCHTWPSPIRYFFYQRFSSSLKNRLCRLGRKHGPIRILCCRGCRFSQCLLLLTRFGKSLTDRWFIQSPAAFFFKRLPFSKQLLWCLCVTIWWVWSQRLSSNSCSSSSMKSGKVNAGSSFFVDDRGKLKTSSRRNICYSRQHIHRQYLMCANIVVCLWHLWPNSICLWFTSCSTCLCLANSKYHSHWNHFS